MFTTTNSSVIRRESFKDCSRDCLLDYKVTTFANSQLALFKNYINNEFAMAIKMIGKRLRIAIFIRISVHSQIMESPPHQQQWLSVVPAQ